MTTGWQIAVTAAKFQPRQWRANPTWPMAAADVM
jgi:hypothetical protein